MTPAAKQKRREKRERTHNARQANLVELKKTGARCSNCSSYTVAPTGMTGHVCDTKSDLEGYVKTNPDGLCLSHSRPLLSPTDKANGGQP